MSARKTIRSLRSRRSIVPTSLMRIAVEKSRAGLASMGSRYVSTFPLASVTVSGAPWPEKKMITVSCGRTSDGKP